MIEILYAGNTIFYNGICKVQSSQPNQVFISIQPTGNSKLLKREGRLAVLNFKLYYHANCLTWVSEWIISPYGSANSMEGARLPDGLHKYFWLIQTEINNL